MSWAPEVIDISSDEEDESPDWIDKLLDEEGDSIDNLVVDQIVKLVEKPKEDDSDDECVILEGDPDKAITVKEDKGGGKDDSDELLIVGEKGQVACRDFPHSRHLCANFPFNTTSHEKHCGLCHCYVCDSPAPCIYWGNGVSLSDHCHANDKAEVWKFQRKSIKESYVEKKPCDTKVQMASLSIRNTTTFSFQDPVPLHAQASLRNILLPCTASSVGSPYVPHQSYEQQPAFTGLIHHQQTAFTGPSHQQQPTFTSMSHQHQPAFSGLSHQQQPAFTGLSHYPQVAVTGPTHHQHAVVTGPAHYQQPAGISSYGQRLGQHPTRSQPSVSETQGLHRGRHGVDASTHSFMQSHAKFKRTGNPGSGLINTGRNRSQDMVSNQIMSSLLQESHYSSGASHRLQQQAVTSQQRLQCMSLASQRSHLPNQCMTVTPEDSVRNLQGIPYDFTYQSFPVSSLPSNIGGQVPSQMVLYPHLGPNATLSYPLQFDNSWSNGTTEVDFMGLGEAVQPSVKQEEDVFSVPVLYDFLGNWN